MPYFSRLLVSGLSAMICLSAAKAQHLVVQRGVPPGLTTQIMHSGGVPSAILSGKILTPFVDVQKAPGQPTIQLTLTAGASGVAFILTSPSGMQHFTWITNLPDYLPTPAQQTLTFLVGRQTGSEPGATPHGLDHESEPGPWTISEIVLNMRNDLTSYKGAQLAELFPSTTVNVVNNGVPDGSTPDLTPPTFGVGAIVTPQVNIGGKSHYFSARLPVSDDGSGVSSVLIYIDNGLPGIAFSVFFASASLTSPVQKGTVEASVEMGDRSQPGTYNITGISVCDLAKSCVTIHTPDEVRRALGANTFEVVP